MDYADGKGLVNGSLILNK